MDPKNRKHSNHLGIAAKFYFKYWVYFKYWANLNESANFYSPWNHQKTISGEKKLISLNLLNIRSEIWRWSFCNDSEAFLLFYTSWKHQLFCLVFRGYRKGEGFQNITGVVAKQFGKKKMIQLFHNNGIGDKGRRTYGNQNWDRFIISVLDALTIGSKSYFKYSIRYHAI